MPILKKLQNIFRIGNRDDNMNPGTGDFIATDTFNHKYGNPQALIQYCKNTLRIPEKDIKVNTTNDATLKLRLPRVLTQEERNAVHAIFIEERRKKKLKPDDDDSDVEN